MDTVSQKAYIRLDKQIPCEYICQTVQNIVTKFQQATQKPLDDSFLVIEIKEISSTEDSTIPKLDFKN